MYGPIIPVVIVDSGIKVDQGYRSYDIGMELGVFIRVCLHINCTIVAEYIYNHNTALQSVYNI